MKIKSPYSSDMFLCICVSSSGCIVAGAESGRLFVFRLQDASSNQFYNTIFENEVETSEEKPEHFVRSQTSFQISSGPEEDDDNYNDICSLCSGTAQCSDTIFIGIGSKLLSCDFRTLETKAFNSGQNSDDQESHLNNLSVHPNNSEILSSVTKVVDSLPIQEDVSDIKINEKGHFLSVADDSGSIYILDLRVSKTNPPIFKKLIGHNNICSSVSFRTRRPWDLISAGFDYRLKQWNFSRSARTYCDIDMCSFESGAVSQNPGSADNSSNSYFLNPPFVHSLAVSHHGDFTAVGTESGQVHIFSSCRQTLEHTAVLRSHCRAVAFLIFSMSTNQQEVLISGGVDGKIFIWKVSEFCKDGHNLQNGNSCTLNGTEGIDGAKDYQSFDPFQEIKHNNKINSLSTLSYGSKFLLAVTDVSSIITIYKIL